jgi:hypothetical protein
MPTGFNNKPNVAQNLVDNLASNLSGIISTRPQARYSSGARTTLKVNGKIVGFAFGVSWRITTAVTEIMTIDDYFPAELAPSRISVEGSISAMHIPGTSAGTELWQADALNFLFQQYVTIEVRDSASDALLFYTSKAMFTQRTEDVKVDQLSQVQLSWKAIGFQDERVPDAQTLPAQANATQARDKSPESRLDEAPNGLANIANRTA